ncbi:transcription cofactor, putative [Medicago truncatula]|uniref:Transcription cofactor, putative n=1 Tax=Medicago truncatula TaxID=3880 RepID=G7IMA4_MEDTR|nr:transcription cofactor, putative [Medicago truncatula]
MRLVLALSSNFANIDTSDWRGQFPPESRQRIVNKIMDTILRHLSISGEKGLHELRMAAQRFEEKNLKAATTTSQVHLKLENTRQTTSSADLIKWIPPN